MQKIITDHSANGPVAETLLKNKRLSIITTISSAVLLLVILSLYLVIPSFSISFNRTLEMINSGNSKGLMMIYYQFRPYEFLFAGLSNIVQNMAFIFNGGTVTAACLEYFGAFIGRTILIVSGIISVLMMYGIVYGIILIFKRFHGIKKQNLFITLRVLVSLTLLGIFLSFADIGKIGQALMSFNLIWLPAVFGLITLSMIISSIKWGILLNTQGNKIGSIELFRIYITALFFNNFLPSSIGGDGVRIFMAGKKSGGKAIAASSVVIERALATVSLALLGLLGAAFTKEPSMMAVYLLSALLLLGIIITLGLLTGWVPAFISKSDKKFARAWNTFIKTSGDLKSYPIAIWKSFLLSFVFQINVALVVWAVMGGLGLPILEIGNLFFISSATSVLAMVPLGLNGYGMREGAYIYLLAPLGYTISSALTVSVLFAVFVSIFSLLGGLNWAMEKHKISEEI